MKRQIKMKLNQDSIKKAIKEIEKYRNSLALKSEMLVDRLLDEGISVAYQHVGKYEGYVEFTKTLENGDTQCVGILTGRDTTPYISEWKVKDGTKSVKVSGILMLEFGSGWLSNVIWDVSGVGQGTFPEQTHAFDKRWFWEDLDGTKHSSRGETPQYPMYFADMTMLSNIDHIAREVFT